MLKTEWKEIFITSSTAFLFEKIFLRLSNIFNSQAPPLALHQPSKTLSTALLLPSQPPLTTISTTNSSPPSLPPSPPCPKTDISLSYRLSLIGMNTPQNFSGVDKGGGGVRYSDEICVRRMGGWEVRCVKEGENEVWRRRESRGDGWRMWRVREDGSLV